MDLYSTRFKYERLESGVEEYLREATTIYNKHVPVLQEEMKKISSATSIDEIRSCMKYALLYYDIRDCYKVLGRTDIVRRFLENRSLLTEYEDMYCILSGTMYLKKYNDIWRTYNLHGPIRDVKHFPTFDPTTHTVSKKANTYNYGLVYGQSLLYMLSRNRPDDALIDFIKECITKITEMSNDAVQYHYSMFADKLLDLSDRFQFGGGPPLPQEVYYEVCDYMMHYLDHVPLGTYAPIERLTFYLPVQSICMELIEHIILAQSFRYTPYLRQLTKIVQYGNPFTDEQREVLRFLKMSVKKNWTPTRVLPRIKVGGRTKRQIRIPRKSLRKTRGHVFDSIVKYRI
jgi:hypothetical protein